MESGGNTFEEIWWNTLPRRLPGLIRCNVGDFPSAAFLPSVIGPSTEWTAFHMRYFSSTWQDFREGGHLGGGGGGGGGWGGGCFVWYYFWKLIEKKHIFLMFSFLYFYTGCYYLFDSIKMCLTKKNILFNNINILIIQGLGILESFEKPNTAQQWFGDISLWCRLAFHWITPGDAWAKQELFQEVLSRQEAVVRIEIECSIQNLWRLFWRMSTFLGQQVPSVETPKTSL